MNSIISRLFNIFKSSKDKNKANIPIEDEYIDIIKLFKEIEVYVEDNHIHHSFEDFINKDTLVVILNFNKDLGTASSVFALVDDNNELYKLYHSDYEDSETLEEIVFNLNGMCMFYKGKYNLKGFTLITDSTRADIPELYGINNLNYILNDSNYKVLNIKSKLFSDEYIKIANEDYLNNILEFLTSKEQQAPSYWTYLVLELLKLRNPKNENNKIFDHNDIESSEVEKSKITENIPDSDILKIG